MKYSNTFKVQTYFIYSSSTISIFKYLQSYNTYNSISKFYAGTHLYLNFRHLAAGVDNTLENRLLDRSISIVQVIHLGRVTFYTGRLRCSVCIRLSSLINFLTRQQCDSVWHFTFYCNNIVVVSGECVTYCAASLIWHIMEQADNRLMDCELFGV